jgi:hypothetical protein
MNRHLSYRAVDTCRLVTSSAHLINYFKETTAFFNSETLLVLPVQGGVYTKIELGKG